MPTTLNVLANACGLQARLQPCPGMSADHSCRRGQGEGAQELAVHPAAGEAVKHLRMIAVHPTFRGVLLYL